MELITFRSERMEARGEAASGTGRPARAETGAGASGAGTSGTEVSGPDTPEARGRALGLRFAHQITRSAELYTDFYRSRGIPEETVGAVIRDCSEALAAWDPDQFAELEAMAVAAAEQTGTQRGAGAGAGPEPQSTPAPDREGRA